MTSYNFTKKVNLLNIKRILNSQFKFFLMKFLPAKLSLSISLFSFIDHGIKKKKKEILAGFKQIPPNNDKNLVLEKKIDC